MAMQKSIDVAVVAINLIERALQVIGTRPEQHTPNIVRHLQQWLVRWIFCKDELYEIANRIRQHIVLEYGFVRDIKRR